MPPPWKPILLVGLCLISTGAAHPWSRAGHEASALIAEGRLDPATQAKIRALLGPGVGLDDIALCSDAIKRRSVNCAGAFFVKRAPHTKAWHYIDIPISDEPAAGGLQQYCPNDDCVTDRIADQTKVLKDPAAPRLEKQVALMHLVHFVGDLHQPLHCADDRDAGGNGKKVWFMAGPRARKPATLHQLWDNMVEKDSVHDRLDVRGLARSLDGAITEEEAAAWARGSTHQWTIESHRIARNTIYPQYARDKGKDLGKDYQDAMRPIAHEQVQKAGVRLAVLLDKTLAGVTVEDLTREAPKRKATPVPTGQKPPKGGGPIPLPGR